MSSEPSGSWRKILPLGLLALAGLFVASAIVMIPWVQNDLTDRVEANAAKQGIAGVSADFDGQDATIRCSQPVADLAELKRIVRGTWGVRVASYEGCTEAAPVETTAPAPVAAVSELAATSTVSAGTAGTAGVVLAGVVDTQAERVQLVADASEAFGADNVTDRLTVAGVQGVDSDADAAALGALTAALAGDLVSGEAGFDGQRLYLRGVAADAAAEARLRAAAADAGAADPDVEISVAERGAPVVILGADGKLRLTGTVETEAQRQALLDAAVSTYGAANVIDELEVLGVEPATQDDDIAGLAALIEAFDPNLASGEAGLGDDGLYVYGVAASAAGEAALRNLVSGAGGASDLAVAEATGANVRAVLDAGSSAIRLTGTVETEAQRQELLNAATDAFGADNVIDELVVLGAATGTQDDQIGNLTALIGTMTPNMVEGVASFDGTKLALTGVYVDDAALAALESAANAAGVDPADVTLAGREVATADQAAELEQRLNDAVGLRPIPFDPSQASLRPEADAILDEVAALAREYAGVQISVDGHTDADGSEAANLALSQARADTVRQALIDRGVPAEQLVANGYGESQPVAPNDTPENKARNRRVVFSVVTQ